MRNLIRISFRVMNNLIPFISCIFLVFPRILISTEYKLNLLRNYVSLFGINDLNCCRKIIDLNLNEMFDGKVDVEGS